MSFVLDASVTLAWILPGQITPLSEAALDRVMRDSAAVPAIWHFEGVSVLSREVSSGALSRNLADKFLLELETLDIRVEHRLAPMARLLALSASYNLTGYDAAYLELALHAHLPLATLDGDLATAARSIGVRLFLAA
jgi:predicted nucleic acid-binding protein